MGNIWSRRSREERRRVRTSVRTPQAETAVDTSKSETPGSVQRQKTTKTGDSWLLPLDQELLAAAIAGDVSRVDQLIRGGVDVNCKGEFFGRSPLHEAAMKGHEDVVRLLLGNGADVDIQDRNGYTPLHDAARNGYESVVRMLLDNNASVDIQNKGGDAPLHNAAWNGHESVVRILLDNNASVDIQNKDGFTPLHNAARYGRESIVRVLLDNNASVDIQDELGSTPLHLDARVGYESVVRVLLDNNASVDIQNKLGSTPLHNAARDGHESVVRVLLDNNASVDIQNKYGYTPLHFAAQHGYESVVRVLLDNNASVDIQNKHNETPLAVAMGRGKTKVAQLLIERGADVSKVNQKHQQELIYSGLITKDVLERGAGDALNRLQERINRGSKQLRVSASEFFRTIARCILLGEVGAGKSSLLKTILSNQPNLVSEVDRTVGIEVCGMEFSEMCKVWWYDFAGHMSYHHTHQLFLTPFSLFFVVVDISKYKCEQSPFDEAVGYWINMITNRVPSAVIRLVATHTDLCTSEQIEARCKDIIKRIISNEEKMEKSLKGRFDDLYKAIENKNAGARMQGIYNGASLEKLKNLKNQVEHLLSHRPDLPTDVLCTSAKDHKGIDEIKSIVHQTITSNPGKFPSMRIPETWLEVEKELLDAREKCKHYPLEDFNGLSDKIGVDPNGKEFEEMLLYFQIIGILIYYDAPELKKYVFHHPHGLLQTLGNIFHHNLRLFKDMPRPVMEEFNKMPQNKQDVLLTNLRERAWIGKDLLKCLLVEFNPDEEFLSAIEALLIKFDICHKVSFDDIKDPVAKQFGYYLSVPALAPDELPQEIEQMMWPNEVPENESEYRMVLQFESQWLPVGLFGIIAVRFNKHMTSRRDWKRGFIGLVSDKITTKVTDMQDERGNAMIVFAMRAPTGTYLQFSEGMVLVLHLNDLVLFFPGAHSMLLVECSECIKRAVAHSSSNAPPYRIHTDVFLSEAGCNIEFLECPNCKVLRLDPRVFFPVDMAGRVTSGGMTDEHRQALVHNRVKLTDDMDASFLISYLFSKGVINSRMKQEIEAKSTKFEKNEALLDCLPTRGDKAFFVFCEALQHVTKQPHLVDLLTKDTTHDKDRCVVS